MSSNADGRARRDRGAASQAARESGATHVERAIRDARPGPALIAFLTAGYPRRDDFGPLLQRTATAADVVEIGVPFSDPMADGVTIQRSSGAALRSGVGLAWILDELARLVPRPAAPLVLMSYLNPLLAFGPERRAIRAREAGIDALIVPDLPYEESATLRGAFGREGLGLVQLVTPVTPPPRLRRLAEASEGFVYAVLMTGVTGQQRGICDEGLDYLDRVRSLSPRPVCAGFGIRRAEDV
ncbi:MAG: tryptophan synthase subunit alpha, partial [Acidobacteriota bacterium]